MRHRYKEFYINDTLTRSLLLKSCLYTYATTGTYVCVYKHIHVLFMSHLCSPNWPHSSSYTHKYEYMYFTPGANLIYLATTRTNFMRAKAFIRTQKCKEILSSTINLFTLCRNGWFPCQPLTGFLTMGVYIHTLLLILSH